VTQLFCAFAEPDAIGLSSVLGQLAPVARTNRMGSTARLSAGAPRQVLARSRAALVVPVGVGQIEPMHPGSVLSRLTRGPASSPWTASGS